MGQSVAKAQAGKWRGFALVRDKDGNPKIDDPATLPDEIKELLTDDEYFKIYKQARK